jgi:predicted metal-dependent phosphoesterase TrpH
VSTVANGLIDLHLHTTASDGRCTPEALVARALGAGVSVMAVTDHDTTASVTPVRQAASRVGIQAITGIEMTAVEDGRDIHVLGYFFNPGDTAMETFLKAQRLARVERVSAIGRRLETLGLPVDLAPVMAAGRDDTRSVGRPQVARAMVEAGHVATVQEAFERWLGHDGPAFIPRTGAPPAKVIEVIHAAGGIASLAHPGKLGLAARVRAFADAGLDAVEVFHPDHDIVLTEQYEVLAREVGLLMTGGSDFHGDPAHGREPGSACLPRHEFERLCAVRPDACR